MANDAKCHELGWICVPSVTDSYGAWGSEAVEALASRLTTLSCRPKSSVLNDIYSSLNLHLVESQCHSHPHQMHSVLTFCVCYVLL